MCERSLDEALQLLSMPEEGDRNVTLQTSSTTNRKNRTDGWESGGGNSSEVLPAMCFIFLQLTETKEKKSNVASTNLSAK